MAKRPVTLKQRIDKLFDDDVIDAKQYGALMQRERYTRGALTIVREKLGETYEDFVAKSYEVASCRGRSHRWDLTPIDIGYRPIGAMFVETERCDRCRKIKVICINGLGSRDRTFYQNPANFTLKGVKTTKQDWKSLCRRMMLDHEIMALEQQLEEPSLVEKTGKVVQLRQPA